MCGSTRGGCCSGALDAEGLLKWEETFLDGSFAPAKKGAPQSVKPSAARERSGWYWSTVKVFRWEFGWKVPLREKLRLAEATARRSPRPQAARPPAAEAETHHRRPRLRLRPAARAVEEARYRTDRPRTGRTTNCGAMKMAANSAATSADGSSSEPMHGSDSSADCWFVTSICSPSTTPSSTSPASGSRSGGVYEIPRRTLMR